MVSNIAHSAAAAAEMLTTERLTRPTRFSATAKICGRVISLFVCLCVIVFVGAACCARVNHKNECGIYCSIEIMST